MSRADNKQNVLGANTADNAFDSTNIGANADGSVLERQEAIKDQITTVDTVVDTLTTNLTTVDTVVDAIQVDVGDPSSRTNLQNIEDMLGNPDTATASIYNAVTGIGVVANSHLGVKVTRAAADIFDGTQTALFTVATGKVMITSISIEVTTAAIDAGASNTKIVTNPTVGTDADMCAVLDINGDENGTIYSITGEPATAMTGGSGGGANAMISPWIVAEGTIDLSSAADVGTGGALGYVELWYIPLDAGATVTAA
jgi:hypothetical protein